MGERTQETPAPAVLSTGEDFSLRSKLIMILLGASALPLIFVTLHAMSEYGRVIAIAENDVTDAAVRAAVASATTSVVQSMYEYAFLSAILIAASLVLADHILVRPVRLLSAWLITSRAVSFKDVQAPPIAVRDEIGVLVHEIRDSIKYFQEAEEREKQISQEKSEFVSIAAHQLRTPLTGIKWVTETLREARDDAHRKELLDQLAAGEARMTRIVEDILNTVRIEEGKFGYEYASIDIAKPLGSLVQELEPLAQARSVALFYKSDRPIVMAYADAERIALAVSNLLSNAIDYTPPGGKVTLALETSGAKVRVLVSDTGIGISNDDRKRLFSKFYRGDNARQMRPDGSGLGLYIARNIALKHGSDITVRSEFGKGTTFSFELPKEMADLKREQPTFEEFFSGI